MYIYMSYVCTYVYTGTLSNAYATHWYVCIYVYTYAHVYGSTRMLPIASDAPLHYKGKFCDSMCLGLCDGAPGGLNYLWGLNTLNTIVECCLKDSPPLLKTTKALANRGIRRFDSPSLHFNCRLLIMPPGAP